MSKNGFRQQPAGSKKEQLKSLQIELKNMQMALRVGQMMNQQMLNKLQQLDNDMNKVMSMFNDLQYRTLATIELANLDKTALDAKADEMKLKAYNEASDKEDAQKNYTVGDVIGENSIVIITSEAPEDRGIFRSKFKLSDSGMPELQKQLLGKKVGDHVTVKLGDLDHDIEVVGVREEPPKPAEPATPEDTAAPAINVSATPADTTAAETVAH